MFVPDIPGSHGMSGADGASGAEPSLQSGNHDAILQMFQPPELRDPPSIGTVACPVRERRVAPPRLIAKTATVKTATRTGFRERRTIGECWYLFVLYHFSLKTARKRGDRGTKGTEGTEARNSSVPSVASVPYFASSSTLRSRITFTLITPGYVSSASIFFAMSFASRSCVRSSIFLVSTKTRISRPAEIA